MIESNELGRMGARRNLKYCPMICLEGLRKTMKHLRQDNSSFAKDSHGTHSEYMSNALEPICLVSENQTADIVLV